MTKVTSPSDWSGFVCVVGPGLDSTSHAFVRSRASEVARTEGAPQKRNRATISGRRFLHNLCRYLQQSNPVHVVSFWT